MHNFNLAITLAIMTWRGSARKFMSWWFFMPECGMSSSTCIQHQCTEQKQNVTIKMVVNSGSIN